MRLFSVIPLPAASRQQLMCFFFQGKRDMQWDNIMFEGNYDGVDVYAQSKLANILFNLELSKRVKCKPHFQINLSILTGYRTLCLALVFQQRPIVHVHVIYMYVIKKPNTMTMCYSSVWNHVLRGPPRSGEDQSTGGRANERLFWLSRQLRQTVLQVGGRRRKGNTRVV